MRCQAALVVFREQYVYRELGGRPQFHELLAQSKDLRTCGTGADRLFGTVDVASSGDLAVYRGTYNEEKGSAA